MTRDRLHAVLQALRGIAGLDVSNAELIKFTNNAVFRLPDAGVVVRIAGSETMATRVDKVIEVARWLAVNDVPAVRLVPELEQPITIDGLRLTLWREVAPVGPAPTGADLANILAAFHALPPPVGGLPEWSPMEEIRQRLEEPDGVAAEVVGYLKDQCDQVEAELAGLTFELPRGPIHGDAFMGNLIPGPDGPVICDFDSTCVGPREWDFTPLAVGKLRFDYAGDAYGDLADRYGFDILSWPGFNVLRRVRELKLVTSIVPVLGSSPALRPQWEHRLRTYRSGDRTTRWSTYSSAT
ncbi:aminoglycoside phosphotransferase family protein [Actinoplanes sp. NPDC024001]|uniref:aminoglycoside phosphotransferase family protein n=1 Tax=Actinoplanes sp. NPDC024001 TaxID=3154598 RepID=UPI0033D7486C